MFTKLATYKKSKKNYSKVMFRLHLITFIEVWGFSDRCKKEADMKTVIEMYSQMFHWKFSAPYCKHFRHRRRPLNWAPDSSRDSLIENITKR